MGILHAISNKIQSSLDIMKRNPYTHSLWYSHFHVDILTNTDGQRRRTMQSYISVKMAQQWTLKNLPHVRTLLIEMLQLRDPVQIHHQCPPQL